MTQQFGALCLEAVHLHVVIKMYTMGTLPYIVGHVVTGSVTLALLSFAQLVVVTRQPVFDIKQRVLMKMSHRAAGAFCSICCLFVCPVSNLFNTDAGFIARGRVTRD